MSELQKGKRVWYARASMVTSLVECWVLKMAFQVTVLYPVWGTLGH